MKDIWENILNKTEKWCPEIKKYIYCRIFKYFVTNHPILHWGLKLKCITWKKTWMDTFEQLIQHVVIFYALILDLIAYLYCRYIPISSHSCTYSLIYTENIRTFHVITEGFQVTGLCCQHACFICLSVAELNWILNVERDGDRADLMSLLTLPASAAC